MPEVDAFFLAAPAQHEERQHSQGHTRPLIKVQPLAEDQQRTDEHHDGACGIDGPHYRQRQMLHAEITEYP